MINPFESTRKWSDELSESREENRKLGWRVAFGLGLLCAILAGSLATAFPLRTVVPFLVTVDHASGNIEVLQTFDSRKIANSDLMNKFWASRYVLAREQYNWWLVGSDYEMVNRLSNPEIFKDYSAQSVGDQSLDKVFGQNTDRRIKILSVRPVPLAANTMAVRFERTTVQKGAVIEKPTIFAVTLAYRYVPKTIGPEIDLIQNPLGYEVYAYRRDVEQADSSASATATSAGGMK